MLNELFYVGGKKAEDLESIKVCKLPFREILDWL